MPEKFVLSSGMRVVAEYMPHLRSVSTGLWIKAGSAYEAPELAGVSHFLEHLLFKGTESRSALDIATAMDSVGGVLNAFTGKEHTCYYTRCLDEHFQTSLALLSDMFFHSLLDPVELDRERNVILEEIKMYEDTPDELAVDLFARVIWPSHSYGRAVAGTIESVSGLSRQTVYDYWKRAYSPANTVLSVAGNIRPETVAALAEESFGSWSGEIAASLAPPVAASGQNAVVKDIEQNHICLGFPAVSLNDPDYYAVNIIVNALGGGASSRLFQEVREKRGLSYSAYAFVECLSAAGFIMAYASAQPSSSPELLEVMAGEFRRLRQQGLSPEEIRKSKQQLQGSLLLSQENSSNLMSSYGKSELSLGRVQTAEERAERLMQVTEADISRGIARITAPAGLTLAQVGPAPLEVRLEDYC